MIVRMRHIGISERDQNRQAKRDSKRGGGEVDCRQADSCCDLFREGIRVCLQCVPSCLRARTFVFLSLFLSLYPCLRTCTTFFYQCVCAPVRA